MKHYRIDKGLKVPEISHPKVATTVSRTTATMLVLGKGDSFLIKDPLEAVAAGKHMRDFLARERRRGGTRTFTSRKVAAGVRIWRVK